MKPQIALRQIGRVSDQLTPEQSVDGPKANSVRRQPRAKCECKDGRKVGVERSEPEAKPEIGRRGD